MFEALHIQASSVSQFLVLSVLGGFCKGKKAQKLKSTEPFWLQLPFAQHWKSQSNLNWSPNNLSTWEETAENFVQI